MTFVDIEIKQKYNKVTKVVLPIQTMNRVLQDLLLYYLMKIGSYSADNI